MYKNILVAIDGSETSARALQAAIKLAKEQSARVRLVHVIDEFPFATPDTGWVDDVRLGEVLFKAGQAIIDEAREQVQKAGLEVETALPQNLSQRIATVIVDEAKRWPADLIVAGTHGRHGIEHLVLGSVAEGVARAASMPVLLIPSHS
ncbi:MAG: universal stress protein [Acidiferrobacteraceae bacterium]